MAYRAPLERVCAGNRTGGSNPPFSVCCTFWCGKGLVVFFVFLCFIVTIHSFTGISFGYEVAASKVESLKIQCGQVPAGLLIRFEELFQKFRQR